jgi:hypothetical protein
MITAIAILIAYVLLCVAIGFFLANSNDEN